MVSAFPHEAAVCASATTSHPSSAAVPQQRQPGLPAPALTVSALVANGVFVGGSWGGGS